MATPEIAADLPLFDPEAGRVVLEPESAGAGYWVGAPAISHDEERDTFLLAYRRRRPRGVGSDRGHVTAIAESRDGFDFEDIWSLEKEALDSTSIERCCVLRCPDGVYRHYLSYVDPADLRWRTDVLEAESPAGFELSRRREVFTAATASRHHGGPVEGVKDPKVFLVDGVYHMLLSIAEGAPEDPGAFRNLHATADVYNTGLLRATTALATSVDGVEFEWQGRCLDTGSAGSWDGYQSRLGTVIRRGDRWYGLYDGSASHRENYEEKCGVARSSDLRSWEKLTDESPLLTSPEGNGSLRYVDALTVGEEILYYYEMAREDGSHELRCARVRA
ncbi:MAG: hypothetical protein O7J95_05090 [Planctomycetota bacterium]|nr:hypothetical protein [Planctomycetota bacterium]